MAHQIVSKPQAVVIHPTQVPSEYLNKPGAHKVTVKYLIDERHASKRFSLRIYTVLKGGNTPLDRHPYEHQVYVLRGQGILRTGENEKDLRPIGSSDVIFVPSNAVHQFVNESDEPLVFLCLKGNPALYGSDVSNTGGSLPERNYC